MTYSICIYLKLDGIVFSVQGRCMKHCAHSARFVLPTYFAISSRCLKYGVLTNTRTYQLAEVARGIRRSSGMTDSSKFRLLSCPGFSWASRACALQWMSSHVRDKKTEQLTRLFLRLHLPRNTSKDHLLGHDHDQRTKPGMAQRQY